MSGPPNQSHFVSIAQAPVNSQGTNSQSGVTIGQPMDVRMGTPGHLQQAVVSPLQMPQVNQQVSMHQVSTAISQQSLASPMSSPLVTQISGQPFAGAINLTIANGAINIKPAMPGSQPMLPDAQQVGTLLKTNINQSTLSKLPLVPQQQAMNLKIPTGHIQMGAMTNITQAGKVPAMIGARPAMVISSPQLRAGTPIIHQGMAQLGHHTMAQISTQALAQVLPQGATQILPQGTVHLPQGAKLVTQMPVTGQIGQPQLGKMPIRPQQALRPAGVTISGTLAMTSSGIPVMTPLPPGIVSSAVTSHSNIASPLVSSPPVVTTAHLLTAQNLQHFNQASQAMVSNAFHLQPIGQPAVATMDMMRPEYNTAVLPHKPELLPKKPPTPATSAVSTDMEHSKQGEKPHQQKEEAKQTESKADVKVTVKEESPDSSDFDPANAMEWTDGIGTLPGSDLKFRMNEFGVVEMVTDDFEDSLECNETLDNLEDVKKEEYSRGGSDDILRCENCGTFGPMTEFCGNGQFCSLPCQDAFSKRKPPLKLTISPDKLRMPGMKKSKKRKLTEDGEFESDSKMSRISDDDSLDSEPRRLQLLGPKKRGFSWSQYLEQEKAIAAPAKLFKDAFPCSKNGFKVGMKLEGIDPRHPSLYCVLSVAEVKGYRLRLHFDGYSECYDFWTNADSPFIFPAGWAEKNGKKLQPPKGFTPENFNWAQYLKLSKFPAAPKSLFTNTQVASVTPHGFRIGMKFEAIDKKNSSLTCVSTVADVLGDRILVHFDGWEDLYDYWCDPSSPYIHPVGWCQQNGKPLSPPNDCLDVEGYTWEEYLSTTKSQPVPARAFKTRPPHGFEVGMKLEVVDKRNPILIRAGSVSRVEDYRLQVHFDGWSDVYDYWEDDDEPDIHPLGWCLKTGHTLTPPITPSELASSPSQGGCPTPGCSGVGHVKGAKYTGHHSAFGCPYSPMNMNKETALQDRLGPLKEDVPSSAGVRLSGKPSPFSEEKGKCPTPGCDGSGHITGKYTAHHRISGCPLAEINKIQKTTPPATATVPKLTLKIPPNMMNGDRPLFGPGSGRGRKKAKILKLIQKQKELEARGKMGLSPVDSMNGSSSALHHGIHQSVFMTSMLPQPSKDLPLCWEQHSKLLPGVDKFKAIDVTNWNIKMVTDLVGTLPGCRDIAKSFEEEQIDGEAFLLLNQADIVKIMNVKLGPALKIYNSILMIKNNVDV